MVPLRAASNSKKAVKPISHSASASLSTYPAKQTLYRPYPKRSPSLSVLESGLGSLHMQGPPQIPLRISSIPPNQSPRKLSLPTQKSYSLLRQEAGEQAATAPNSAAANTSSYRGNRAEQRPRTPPQQLMTMKELPSPPTADYDEGGVRGMVMGSEPQIWSQSPPPPPTRGSAESATSRGHGEMESLIVNPVIPPSPPQPSSTHTPSTHSHPRSAYAAHTHSRTSSSSYSSFPAPPHSAPMRPNVEHFAAFDWSASPGAAAHAYEAPPEIPRKAEERRSKKAKKVMGIEDGYQGQGRPVPLSRTQKEKERKKRGRARVVVEHVDIIGERFWERRPWILSGRAG